MRCDGANKSCLLEGLEQIGWKNGRMQKRFSKNISEASELPRSRNSLRCRVSPILTICIVLEESSTASGSLEPSTMLSFRETLGPQRDSLKSFDALIVNLSVLSVGAPFLEASLSPVPYEMQIGLTT